MTTAQTEPSAVLYATLGFLFGLIVISSLQRYANVVTIVLSIIAVGLLSGCVEITIARGSIEQPLSGLALEMLGD
jgi:hypothetical protein